MSNSTSSMSLVFSKSMEDVQSDTTTKILALIQLSYGIPSLVLMIVFLVLLTVSKKYSNSFYRLVQFDLLVNILIYTNSWFAVRIDKHPVVIPFLKWLTEVFPSFLTWVVYLAYMFLHLQFVSAVVLSVHRITSVYLHMNNDKYWNLIFIFFCLGSILYSCICNSLIPGHIVEVSILNGTLTKTTYVGVYTVAVSVTAYFSAAYFFLLVSVGISTSWIVTRKIESMSLTNGGIGKKLNKIAVTYGSIYTGILLWSIISALNANFNFLPDLIVKFNSYSLPFSSDMMTLALPYILMVYDTNVKQDVFRKKSVSASNSRIISSSFVITRQ
ncbi:Serpentine receptor class gamma [Caenorhabditis elegans]|uniref:Serpentine receptor class gamma n=1 Tax=Caenorhabditis elegans TaxID=6239 RepID=Q9N5G5_CAEEL|nr:Serpentine receptor class gamma [Caenorhabditis elegans]CCD65481.1 Serpentine receptor class gamma [Caenorhabditis elegans]|eukprot:NP_503750.1 Serpentine receptor class gamma [Caenorhabditis elegans]